MPWCPKCKAEFVDGITECSDCKVPLVDELPEEEELFALYQTKKESIAKKLVKYLEYSGVDVTSEFSEEDSQYHILVSKEQVKKAKKYFDAFFAVEYTKAEKKKKGPIGEIMDQVQLLFSMFKDSINGNYKDIPKGSIIMIIIGLVYFVSPVDIIPDFIVAGGFLDDATILGFIIRQLKSDLDNYKIWKDSAGKEKQLE
jgi:uncharacterized membrane protein YkvA (DUF1232 family)